MVYDEDLGPPSEMLEIVYENKLRAGLAEGIDCRGDAVVWIDKDDICLFGGFESPIKPGVAGLLPRCLRRTRFILQTSLVVRGILRKKLAGRRRLETKSGSLECPRGGLFAGPAQSPQKPVLPKVSYVADVAILHGLFSGN